jgi:methyl-accepting chemotaxis protein
MPHMTNPPSAVRGRVQPSGTPEPVEDSDTGPRIRFGMVGKTTVTMLAVGLLPLALFGGATLYQQSQRIRAGAERSMQASGERISSQVDEWFDKNVRVLQAAASLPGVGSMHADEQTRVLTAVQQAYPWMYLVFTVAPNGSNVARSDGKPLTDYSDRQYYKDVALGGKTLAWETLIGKTSKKPALILAVPIRANGALVGVLAAAMSIEDVSKIIAHWRTGRSGFAFLVDEHAKVVAHPSEQFVLAQQHLDDQPLVAAFRADQQPHLMSFTQTDGKDVLGYVQGNRFGWAVAIQQDEEELFAPLRQTLMLGLALLAAAAILVGLTARISSKLLIRPILAMTRAADLMSMGALEKPITFAGHDEIGLLARSLERLRKSMRAAMARLK